MYHHITGVILAGGKSSRMGTNKSFLRINGEYIIERIAKLTSSLFNNVFISTNTPDEYEFLRLPTIQDIHHGIGPLAGIHSGLLHSTTEKIFVISCDVPLMNKETISFIVDYPIQKNIVIPKADGFIQQLCGIYSKSVVHSIETIVKESEDKKKGCRVLELVQREQSEIIEIEKVFPHYKTNTFLNMNTLEDYKFISSLHTSHLSLR